MNILFACVLTHTSHPHPTAFHAEPSYILSSSFVVSYHWSHCDGLDGAVDDLIAHGNVFEISLFAFILIQVEAVYEGISFNLAT